MDGLTVIVEAATYEGSVAVVRDGVLVAAREVAMRGITEERLMPAVADALADAGVQRGMRTRLDRVVCGAGPGSFTSLRIAAGIAKGLCAGASIPLFAVSSLALAVPPLAPGRYLVTLDALRDESYAALFAWDGDRAHQVFPTRITASEALPEIAAEHDAMVIDARPRAEHAVVLLRDAVAAGAVDRASWEPSYGRLAEAQVKWEAAHGRPLSA